MNYFPDNENFNSEQKKAFCELVKYIDLLVYNKDNESVESLFFLLNGAGGSGKTYLVSVLLKHIKKLKLRYEILAPTHKACGVIKKSLEKEEINTLAKFLGYTEEIDEDGEKTVVYKYKPKAKKFREDVLIIDECSMISKEQLQILKETKISIIFVGDICQINPVGEEVSEVFSCDFFGSAELKKNERVSNKELAETILDFRDSVLKGFLKKTCIENKYRIQDRLEFNRKLFESFRNDKETIYIAWTNSQVKTYNSLIRENLFGTNAQDFEEGENLLFDSYYVGDKNRFFTSQPVKIKTCCKLKKEVLYPRCICNKKNESFYIREVSEKSSEKIEKCQACHTPTSMSSFKTVEFWVITLEGFDGETLFKPVKGMSDLYPIIYKYRDRCKALKNKLRWFDYYKMVEKLNAPLEYAYSISVHKSQGSGYENTFVDLENINWCTKNSEKLRLAYTAISRSKENLSFFK